VILTVAVTIGGFVEAPSPNATTSATGPDGVATDCAPASATTVPVFTLGVAGGPGPGIGGLVGTTQVPGEGGWQVPAFDPGREIPVVPSGAALEIRSSGPACFGNVFADFAHATLERMPNRLRRWTLRAGTVEPPSRNPGLGTLPDGDWVVRVVVSIVSGAGGPDDPVWGERFFRLRVGPAPYPTPTPEATPAVTPAVACGPAPATPGEVQLTLTAPGGEAIAGVDDGTDATTVAIPLGETGTLAVVGDACALSWDISVVDAETGRPFNADIRANPADDPELVTQNRWRVWSTIGDFFLVANLHFGPGVDVGKVWRIEGPGFTVPDTFLVAADGRRAAALPGCGLTFTLPNGYSVADACDSGRVPDGLRLLRVPAWSRVVVDVAGWTVTAWDGSCGRLERDSAGFEVFNEPDFCPLGAYSVADDASPPAPMQFLARPGEWTLRIHVRAMKGGATYDVQMYARVAGQ
jgi:hypothetical protein